MVAELSIRTFALGDWMTNCHVVHVTGGSDCWIVDAGFEPWELMDFIAAQKLNPVRVVLTHAHVDHIAGLTDVRRKWPDIPILIHEAEREFLTDPMLNLSAMLADPVIAPAATELLTQGMTLDLDGVTFHVRHTPGHSPGGISLYQPQAAVAIVGDALFAGSIGRTDFPTSNHRQLIAAIRSQLLTLPDETQALPGHGPSTTIGEERRHNPFLND